MVEPKEMENITLDVGQILPLRRPNRYLLSEIREKERKGSLFFLIEMEAFLPQVAESIFETAKETYFEETSPPPSAFEEAIRRTNEVLAQITQEGETEWIGNLNGLICLIFENKLHLTSLGKVYAYLFREGEITHVTSDQPKEAHPLKTFSNLISGDLEVYDKLIVANEEFFDHLSLDYLNQISRREASAMARLLSNSLSKEGVKTASAFIIELKKGGLPKKEKIYLGEKRRIFPYLKVQARPISLKLFGFLKKWGKIFVIQVGKGILKLGRLIDWTFLKKYKTKIITFIILILALILLLEVSSFIRKKVAKKEELEREEKLLLVENRIKEGEIALEKGDKEGARKIFEEALSLVSSLKRKGKEEEIKLKEEKIKESLFRLTNALQPKLKEILDFKEGRETISPSQLFIIEKTPYTIDSQNNAIYQGKKQINSFPQKSGRFICGTFSETEKILIAYQDLEGIYHFKMEENKIEKPELGFGQSWKKADLISSYLGNLYILNKSEGQIYRYPKTTLGYGKAQEVVDKSKVDLKQVVSFAIDGYIYTLNSQGEVLKLLLGKQVPDFSLKGIPDFKIKKPKKIYTHSDLSSLYISDNEEKRILEFDKSGNYLRQFIFPDLSEIKDFWVAPKIKKIYLLSQTKVYEFGL